MDSKAEASTSQPQPTPPIYPSTYQIKSLPHPSPSKKSVPPRNVPPLPQQAGPSSNAAASASGSQQRPIAQNAPAQIRIDDVIPRTAEEKRIIEGNKRRVEAALATDHYMVGYPDLSPFNDGRDVVKRMLPYHIFQVPDEDLLPQRERLAKSKGKGRARDWEEEEEREELKEALGFARRHARLKSRFDSLRKREGMHASRSADLIQLSRSFIENEIKEVFDLKQNIRTIKEENAEILKGYRPPQQRPPQTTGTSRPPGQTQNVRPPPPRPLQQAPPGQQQQTAPPPAPPIDLNRPISINLNLATIPRLLELGIIGADPNNPSDPTAVIPLVATNIRFSGQFIVMTLVLAELSKPQLGGLAAILNAPKNTPAPVPASGSNPSTPNSTTA